MPPVIAWVATALVTIGVPAAIATWVATLVVNGIIMFAAQKLLVKKPDLGNFMGDVAERQQMVRQSVAPRRLVYGRCKTSGPMIFAHETSNKQFLHIVIALAAHKSESVDEVYLNDELLTLDGSGNATGTYAGLVRVQWKLGGAGQTAFSDLVTESGGLWNANCKGEGTTLLYVRVKFDSEKFPGGIPNFSVVMKGKKVLDPRTGITAWSDNAGLCIYDYMRDTRYGLRATADEFDEDDLFASLNNCDEDVLLADGVATEKRYTINGTIDTDQLPEDILGAMLSSMAGRLAWAGGKWYLKSGYWQAPDTAALTELDMRGNMQVTTRTSRRDLFNACKGTYVGADDHWQATDFVPYAPAIYLDQDGGERLWRDLQLPFTLSPSTARRLAKLEVERGRQQITVRIPCKLTALRFQCGDNIYFTHERMGWTNKLFEVTGFVLTPFKTKEGEDAIGVDLTLKETASTVYDWNNGDDVTTDLAPNTNLPDPRNVVNPTGLTLTSGAAVAHAQPDGTKLPRLRVQWTAPLDQYVLSGGFIEVEFKKSSESVWLQWGAVPGSYTEDVLSDVLAGVDYDVRIRSVNALGIHATTWIQQLGFAVTGDLSAPAVPTGLTAIAGSGKSISLDWADNTESDFQEYWIYRHTANDSGAAVKLAEQRGSRFVDIDVSIGTTYYYWIRAQDTSQNLSGFSSAASATPTAVSTSPDNTAPTAPAAPTLTAGTPYLSGDGTVFSRITVSAITKPGDARGLMVFLQGPSSELLVVYQEDGDVPAFTIDDLVPDQQYKIFVASYSSFGVKSGLVAATNNPFTAPGVGAPTSPVSAGVDANDIPLMTYSTNNIVMYGAAANWTHVQSADFSHYLVKATFDNNSSSVVYTWGAPHIGGGAPYRTTAKRVIFYTDPISSGHVFVKAVNRSGQESAWVYIGQLSSVGRLSGGTMSGQSADNVRVTGLKVGSGSAVTQTLVETRLSVVVNLAGGSLTEDFNVDLTNRGFSSKPTAGLVQEISANLVASYNHDAAGSTSTNAVVTVRTRTGANVPTGLHRFSVHLWLTS